MSALEIERRSWWQQVTQGFKSFYDVAVDRDEPQKLAGRLVMSVATDAAGVEVRDQQFVDAILADGFDGQ